MAWQRRTRALAAPVTSRSGETLGPEVESLGISPASKSTQFKPSHRPATNFPMGLFIPPRANSVQSHCVNHTVPPLKSSYSASQLFQTIMKTCLISLFKYFFVCFEKFNWQIESLFICLPTDGRKEQHSEHPCTPYLVSPIIILPHPLRLCMCKYIQHISLLPNHPIEVCRHDSSYPNTSACTSLNRNILWNYNTITTKKLNMDLMTSSNLQSVFS